MLSKNPQVDYILKRRRGIIELSRKYPTPFYIFDPGALEKSIKEYTRAFQKHLFKFKPFYAIKANPHPYVIATVLKHDFGLDVSSGDELKLALKHKAKHILFSGPGKSIPELNLALAHHKKVTVNIDSFSELKKLGALSSKNKITIRAGIRVFTRHHGKWNKFGINLNELKKFWMTAKKFPYIQLQGIQFHLSHNKNVTPYQNIIKEIGTYLKKTFSEDMLSTIKFVDFGGGFYTDKTEGIYDQNSKNKYPHYKLIRAQKIEIFSKGIAGAIRKYLKPILKCSYYSEPGRIICTYAMHIVLKVEDKKNKQTVITDGGVNMIGVGSNYNYYLPLINLTRPSIHEKKYIIYGPLCTPKDMWGYHCYANKIEEGDTILVPNQGAYTYSLAQNFIKSVPKVYKLK